MPKKDKQTNDPGIIPAYAGSTRRLSLICTCLVGSSPHTRGAPLVDCAKYSYNGDHPRIRGEHVPTRE